MVYKKELTAAQRGAILYGHQRGDSCRKIAETVHCSKSAVCNTLKRYTETGSTDSRPRKGRPKLFNTPQRTQLKRLVTNDKTKNRRLCAAGIQALWKKKTTQEASTPTIRRTLHSIGLRNCVTRRKPLISPENMAARLAWCQKYKKWKAKDWGQVLWSDESTFSQFQQSRSSRVWREPSEEWAVTCLSATVKHPPSRMHWGCFSRGFLRASDGHTQQRLD